MRTIAIVATPDRGLRRDVQVLEGQLRGEGVEVVVVWVHSAGAWSVTPKRFDRPLADRVPDPHVVIFLEHVFPLRDLLRSRAIKVYVPNPEHMTDSDAALAHSLCDWVLHKTGESERVWREMVLPLGAGGPREQRVGWMTPAPPPTAFARDYGRFLHIAGGSPSKGTTAVLALWEQHPEWPPLELVADILPASLPPHVHGHSGLEQEALERLLGECGVHVAPSCAEGWGHSLGEALAAGAVLITLDAGVAREVAGDAAVLARSSRSLPFREVVRGRLPPLPWDPNGFGLWHEVDPESLREAVEAVRALPLPEREARGRRGKERHAELCGSFASSFRAWMGEAGLGAPPAAEDVLVAPHCRPPVPPAFRLLETPAADAQGWAPEWAWVLPAAQVPGAPHVWAFLSHVPEAFEPARVAVDDPARPTLVVCEEQPQILFLPGALASAVLMHLHQQTHLAHLPDGPLLATHAALGDRLHIVTLPRRANAETDPKDTA